MSRKIVRRQAARRDLVDIAYHYIQAGTPSTARRFRQKAEAALSRLAAMPGMGKLFEHDHPALAELRYFPLASPFQVYLVFYRPTATGLEIVRVLHGAREVGEILMEEFGDSEHSGGSDPET